MRGTHSANSADSLTSQTSPAILVPATLHAIRISRRMWPPHVAAACCRRMWPPHVAAADFLRRLWTDGVSFEMRKQAVGLYNVLRKLGGYDRYALGEAACAPFI